MAASVPTAGAPSRRAALVSIIASACATRGHALTLGDIRNALRESNVDVPALGSEVSSLKRSGIVIAVRSGGALRYAPATAAASLREAPATEGMLVAAALADVCAREGRMVSTYEVARMCVERGHTFTSAARSSLHADECVIRHRLQTMARVRETTRAAEINRPTVRLVRIEGTDGRLHSYWAPTSSGYGAEHEYPPPADASSASAPEAIRTQLRDAVRAAGRPVSRAELGLHILQLPINHPARRVLTNASGQLGIAPALASALRGSKRAGAPGVRTATTPWTAYGGAPERFWLGTADEDLAPAAANAMLLSDLSRVWPLAREATGVATLDALLTPADRVVLRPILDARQMTLRAATAFARNAFTQHELVQPCVRRGVTPSRAAASETLHRALDAALEVAERADVVVARWARATVRAAVRTTRGRVSDRGFDARSIEVAAVERRNVVRLLHRCWDEDAGNPSSETSASLVGLAIVGGAAAVPVDGLAPFAAGVVDLHARDGALAQTLRNCRRFPAPPARRRAPTPASRVGESAAHVDRPNACSEAAGLASPLSHVDRAEALVDLAGIVPSASTRLVLKRAYVVLGEIARDRDAVARSLDVLAAADARAVTPAVRRWLVAAAALVRAPGTEDAAYALATSAQSSADGMRDLRAALIALALNNPAAVMEAIGAVRQRLGADAAAYHAVVERAAIRVRKGYLLSLAA